VNDNENRPDEIEESNAARRLRALGDNPAPVEEEPIKVNKWANFWHYNKTKIIIAVFFAVVLGVGLGQLLNRQNPDVSILYAGPDYVSPNDAENFCSLLEGLMDDYNGDGRKYVQLEDLVYMSEDQITAYLEAAKADDENATVDRTKNKNMEDRFVSEVFAGSASLCILAEDQYEIVANSGGFVPLSELFATVPESAIDDYGIRFAETKFAKFYNLTSLFPADSVIALRTLPTASAITGKERAEKLHTYAEALYRIITEFEYPAGYTPTN